MICAENGEMVDLLLALAMARIDDQRVGSLGALVLQAARDISAEMGGPGRP